MLWQKPQTVRVRPLGFRPPRLVLDAELEWVLQRALGPLAWTPRTPVCGQRLIDVALRLDVASRIASRHPRELLERRWERKQLSGCANSTSERLHEGRCSSTPWGSCSNEREIRTCLAFFS